MKRKVKSIMAVLLTGALLLGPVGVGAAATVGTTVQSTSIAATAPTVNLNGQQLTFDVPPRIENGRTLVPLRKIFEALGATVTWDEATRTVTAVKGTTTIKLTIDKTTAYKNGSAVTLETAAKIVDGRTLVPLRFVSEALGATVNWSETSRLVTITSASTTSISDLQSKLNTYLEDVGEDYFKDDGIEVSCSLSGSSSSLSYTLTFDLSDADDYEDLTDISQSSMKTFINAFKYQLTAILSGTDYANASISGSLIDSDSSKYYVTVGSSSTVTFSWDGSGDEDLSDIADDLEDTFNDAGDEYFDDEDIDFTVTLSGDEDDIAYTIKADFDDSDSYSNLTKLDESDIEDFLDDFNSELEDAIEDTDYEDADITGKLVDASKSSYYVKDNGKTYSYSWDDDDDDFSLSDLKSDLNDDYENAGKEYFDDDGIETTISLSGDEDELTFTVKLDFGSADDYDELSDLSKSDMESLMEDIADQISEEIEDTDYEDAEIAGKLVDADDSDQYVKYDYDDDDFTYHLD